MPLKTIVKVGNISNLSDARYCAGMGVDMLGFRVIDGLPGYIAPQAFQEIRGWISGPKVVAEIYGIDRSDKIPHIVENYAPDCH
jgi:phosphoribosylanthranilate isomerase